MIRPAAIRVLLVASAASLFVISQLRNCSSNDDPTSHQPLPVVVHQSIQGFADKVFIHHPSESCLTDAKQTFVSICSCKADNRGLHQNVIAFSLYGNFSDPKHFDRYVDPIKATMANISQVYPGWVVRIYSALENGDQVGNLRLRQLFDSYPFVDLCNVTRVMELININRPLFPMTWRFLPLLDPTVDRLLPRDSDSHISGREVDAVRQWLSESKATFHLMRDHVWHCVEILGGFWGAKIYQRRHAIRLAATRLFYHVEHKMEYGFDQVMLTKFLWPLAIDDALAHDSYCCQKFPSTSAFPTQRQGSSYVAKVVHQELVHHTLPDVCPEKCRPKQHPDWIYC